MYVTFLLQEKRKQAVRTGRYVDLTDMTDEALETVQTSVEAHHRVKQDSINAVRYAAANAIETKERRGKMVLHIRALLPLLKHLTPFTVPALRPAQ